MLINLIQTILITLGMVNNVNANISFEKKTKHKAVENISINETFKLAQTFNTTDTEHTYVYKKWYIGQNNPTYLNSYLQVINTTYTEFTVYKNTYQRRSAFYGLYKISNFYRSNINITLSTNTLISDNNRTVYYGKNWGWTYNNESQYINMTLTNSIGNELTDLKNDFTWTTTDTGTETAGTSGYNMSMTTETISLQPEETIYILFYYTATTYQNFAQTDCYPATFQVTGQAILPEINDEVVDIPGLMFTILTLPFSFISQAFDLTIFPNTPYEINFTNLFMTVIAIFVLLWLIKHIFK